MENEDQNADSKTEGKIKKQAFILADSKSEHKNPRAKGKLNPKQGGNTLGG